MRSLEEIDPELLNQVIRRLLAQPRAVDREAAIAARLQQSAELKEWIEMLNQKGIWEMIRAQHLTLAEGHLVQLYIAFSLGLECGYVCYEREMER